MAERALSGIVYQVPRVSWPVPVVARRVRMHRLFKSAPLELTAVKVILNTIRSRETVIHHHRHQLEQCLGYVVDMAMKTIAYDNSRSMRRMRESTEVNKMKTTVGGPPRGPQVKLGEPAGGPLSNSAPETTILVARGA